MATLLVCVTMAAQRKCKACNGTGTIVKSISVSQYGHTNGNYYVKCPTCGKRYLKSTGHSHITCKQCGGTGYIGSSSYGSTGGSASERLQEIAIANPQVYNAVMTLKYGLSMSEEEAAEVNSLGGQNARQYMKWRDVINNYTINANRSITMGWIFGNVRNIDQMKAQTDAQLAELIKTFSVTDNLMIIADQLYTKYQNAYIRLRKAEESKQNLNNVQERIFNYQLNRPLW